jgi:predicted oxidoreductase (fatty acid repression mutant protein)
MNERDIALMQILFYDDPAAVQEIAEKRPIVKDHLPQCEQPWSFHLTR